MKIIKFDTPIIKSSSEMRYGDIFLTELGDFDNWVELVFESCTSDNLPDWTKIKYHIPNGALSAYCYENNPISKVKFKVIGKEESEDNSNE